MNAVTGYPTPGSMGAVGASPRWGRDDSPQSPGGLRVTVVTQQQLQVEPGADGPVKQSSRLSCLPPPQPPVKSQDTDTQERDRDESIDDESESVNDVALHLSRDETPENDDLLLDEPSTVLANRIMRAHDNPSPPPQDLAHPGVNYVPGKDGQFPLSSVSVPPSPFRDINLLEHINQFSDPLSDTPRSPRTTALGVRPDISDTGIIPLRDFISSQSSLQFIASAPMKNTPHEDLASADTNPSLSTASDLPSRSSRRVCEPANIVNDSVIDPPSQPIAGLHRPSIAIDSSHESGSPPAQVVGSSLNFTVPSASQDRPGEPLQFSEQRQSESSSPLPRARIPSIPLSSENGEVSPGTEAVVPRGQSDCGEENLPADGNLPYSNVERESKCRATSPKVVDANLLQRLDSLPTQSTNVFTRSTLSQEQASSIREMVLPTESIHMKPPLTTPPRTPMPSMTYPDFSQTSVHRPVVTPTPVRADSIRRLNSPTKLPLEIRDVSRTPAQRVPLEAAIGRGTPSIHRTVQLSTGSNQSRPGGVLTIRVPVFTRPALDSPSRSPAKRIPITRPVASPAKDHQDQGSPTRFGPRFRSASIEPRPFETILARSRSVDPCAMISKPDNHGLKESVFPMVPVLARAGAKLPFPLVSSQKTSSDLPPPIPEEHENAETGNTGIGAALGTATQDNKISQLRQPSTSSRIPRIGNTPYARPPRNGRVTSTATVTTARVPGAFQIACKKSGAGNSSADVSSAHANDQRSVAQGSLKRKRSAEAAISRPVIVRQVVPGILSRKYAPKPAKAPSQVQAPSESSPLKVPQPFKFRKVVDGMLSARYVPAKVDLSQMDLPDSTPLPPSPLSELSSSDDGSSDEKFPHTACLSGRHKSENSDVSRTAVGASVAEPSTHHQVADRDEACSHPRRTSRTRKPAQQQYVLDVFNGNTTTRPPSARRKPQPRTEGDCFMGMSATALKALTTSNTTKNQQTIAVLATEVIRKEGLRPESPMVKARTILQKQRDERDMRRIERAQRRAQLCGGDSGSKGTEGQSELDERVSLAVHADHDESHCVMPQKHRRGPGDEEDYETPEQPEYIIEPLRLEGVDRKPKSTKQVKWHHGLSTTIYLDEVDPRPKSLPRNTIVRGCLAPTSKSLLLDSLGNLVDVDSRLSPELIAEHIVIKRYIYDNDIEPDPIPAKMTRSKSKKSRS